MSLWPLYTFDGADCSASEAFTSIDPSTRSRVNPKGTVPKKVKDAIKHEIETYRYALCLELAAPNATLLVGLEIVSGISDKAISTVVDKCKHS